MATPNGSLSGNQESDYLGKGGAMAGGTQHATTFAGSRLETATAPGVSYFRNRTYDQTSGRWLQEDPIGIAGGLNLYQYNGNDPVSNTDPFGLCDDPDDPKCKKPVVAVGASVSSVAGKGGGAAAGVILYSGEGPGVYFRSEKSAGAGTSAGPEGLVSENMDAFKGRSAHGCAGTPATGTACVSTNSSGKAVGYSPPVLGVTGPIPVTATAGESITVKLTWADVKKAVFEWAKPGLDIITGATLFR